MARDTVRRNFDGTNYALTTEATSDMTSGADRSFGLSSAHALIFKTDNTERARIGSTGILTLADAVNIVVGSTTGTKIGTAATQKLGFFNATPIVQPANTTDLRTALINLGLYASGGASPLDLNGGTFRPGNIERDDNAVYTDRQAWQTFYRSSLTVPTGTRSLLDLRLQAKHAGTISDRNVGINVVMLDHGSVTNKTITNAVNNGSGLIRITATAHGWATSDRIAVYGVGGVTAANGAWTITVIDANTFDLQGSVFAGTYTSGGTATNRGLMYGISSTVYPNASRGGLTGTAQYGDDLNGLTISNGNGNNFKATDALYISGITGHSNSEWFSIFSAECHADHGITLTGTIQNYGLDLVGPAATGSQLQGCIRVPNNTAIVSRNAANSSNLNMIKMNNLDEVEILQTFRVAQIMRISGGVNIGLSATTGTKLGTGTTQLLGFWNATPVARPTGWGTPTGTAARTTYATSTATVTQLAQRLKALIDDLTTIGIIGA